MHLHVCMYNVYLCVHVEYALGMRARVTGDGVVHGKANMYSKNTKIKSCMCVCVCLE